MNRQVRTAAIKVTACLAVAISLLLIWCFGGDAWFRPVAAVAFIVVGAPVTLLVSIDTGKVLRRQRLGTAASIATRLPQLFLAAVAWITSAAGVVLSLLAPFPSLWHRLACALCQSASFSMRYRCFIPTKRPLKMMCPANHALQASPRHLLRMPGLRSKNSLGAPGRER
jgi:hypothetical protein